MTPETDAVARLRREVWRWYDNDEQYDWASTANNPFLVDVDALIAAARAAGAEEALARCVTCSEAVGHSIHDDMCIGCDSGVPHSHHPYLPFSALKERHEQTERVVEAVRLIFRPGQELGRAAVNMPHFMAFADALAALDAAQKERGA